MLSLLVLLIGVIYHSEQIAIFSTISSQRHNSYYKHDDDTWHETAASNGVQDRLKKATLHYLDITSELRCRSDH